ncbi:MAG: TIGR04283 family arsenosugar biosynthesis glycosyltransferase [Gammaproteobacteria bacterium]|nr:MAG: TIGR04283 family arsenosugar biosynthesis glycosyltransferase [Gammaproteobacteria bacterium]
MISVVIPAYNEERALPQTLDHLFSQPGEYEVILVDGGSTDATRRIARHYPRVRLVNAPRGRASQMNAGAVRARGDWLVFLHADTVLPENGLARIAELPKGIAAGGFRHRFSGRGFGLWFVSLADNIRCRSTRIIFGDQAMFIRRSLFSRLEGFPDVDRLEDVVFCEKLVKHTRPVLLDQAVVTDSRKFVQHGVWRSLTRVVVILLCVNFDRQIPGDSLRFFEDVR